MIRCNSAKDVAYQSHFGCCFSSFSNPSWALTVLQVCERNNCMRMPSRAERIVMCLFSLCQESGDLCLQNSFTLYSHCARFIRMLRAYRITSYIALIIPRSKKPYNSKPYMSRRFGHKRIVSGAPDSIHMKEGALIRPGGCTIPVFNTSEAVFSFLLTPCGRQTDPRIYFRNSRSRSHLGRIGGPRCF